MDPLAQLGVGFGRFCTEGDIETARFPPGRIEGHPGRGDGTRWGAFSKTGGAVTAGVHPPYGIIARLLERNGQRFTSMSDPEDPSGTVQGADVQHHGPQGGTRTGRFRSGTRGHR
ncbi:hypothetical protein BN873_p60010 [Candidatus Competibacter denitrificans Run_A_D11]|uniref:Uncharacterized protein n=1 Tax=Candidatus Competibacter denitrificans Run_A_D11 TaxID=1400863 RepID=W6MD94_9GAMM|nr:hypothetical protein BN873_p60010 [Candidatus Competibacter denitrificans Run_A_D11]